MERRLYNDFCSKSPLSLLLRTRLSFIIDSSRTVIGDISTISRILKKFSNDINHKGLYFMCKGWGDEVNYNTKESIENTFNTLVELSIMIGENYLESDNYINNIRPLMIQCFRVYVKNELEDFYLHFDEGLEIMFSRDNNYSRFKYCFLSIYDSLTGIFINNDYVLEQETIIRNEIRECERNLVNFLDNLVLE